MAKGSSGRMVRFLA